MTTTQHRQVKNLAPMILTPRDEDIIRAVGRFRFLTGHQITELFAGSKQGVLRRLTKLFRHGYLNRPKTITVQISMPGFKGMVYALGPRGRKYLASQGVLYSHRQQEKEVKVLYLAHTLKVAQFMIDLLQSLPEDVILYHHDEFRVLFSAKPKAKWNLPIQYMDKEVNVGVIPDYLFALVRGNEVCVYCLEIDRGTMPVYREKPIQTSFIRKILAYHETWKTGFAAENFDWNRFRVVTVTSSQERSAHLISSCKRACRGRGGEKNFLFSSDDEVACSENLFYHPWSTGKGKADLLLG